LRLIPAWHVRAMLGQVGQGGGAQKLALGGSSHPNPARLPHRLPSKYIGFPPTSPNVVPVLDGTVGDGVRSRGHCYDVCANAWVIGVLSGSLWSWVVSVSKQILEYWGVWRYFGGNAYPESEGSNVQNRLTGDYHFELEVG
jgi:hypothetical protein